MPTREPQAAVRDQQKGGSSPNPSAFSRFLSAIKKGLKSIRDGISNLFGKLFGTSKTSQKAKTESEQANRSQEPVVTSQPPLVSQIEEQQSQLNLNREQEKPQRQSSFGPTTAAEDEDNPFADLAQFRMQTPTVTPDPVVSSPDQHSQRIDPLAASKPGQLESGTPKTITIETVEEKIKKKESLSESERRFVYDAANAKQKLLRKMSPADIDSNFGKTFLKHIGELEGKLGADSEGAVMVTEQVIRDIEQASKLLASVSQKSEEATTTARHPVIAQALEGTKLRRREETNQEIEKLLEQTKRKEEEAAAEKRQQKEQRQAQKKEQTSLEAVQPTPPETETPKPVEPEKAAPTFELDKGSEEVQSSLKTLLKDKAAIKLDELRPIANLQMKNANSLISKLSADQVKEVKKCRDALDNTLEVLPQRPRSGEVPLTYTEMTTYINLMRDQTIALHNAILEVSNKLQSALSTSPADENPFEKMTSFTFFPPAAPSQTVPTQQEKMPEAPLPEEAEPKTLAKIVEKIDGKTDLSVEDAEFVINEAEKTIALAESHLLSIASLTSPKKFLETKTQSLKSQLGIEDDGSSISLDVAKKAAQEHVNFYTLLVISAIKTAKQKIADKEAAVKQQSPKP